MSKFVLVHGGAHSSSCWELFEPELRRRGHECLAVDMPVDDVTAGIDDYVTAVITQMAGFAGSDDRVVLVGHSLAGHVVPFVAQRTHVDVLVYLCSALPGDYDHTDAVETGQAPAGLRPDDPAGFSLDDEGRAVISPEAAFARFYHDCTPEVADRMIARLRPQSQSFRRNVPVLNGWPAAKPYYIACDDDRSSAKSKATRAGQRLGVEPLQLPGGHSPFASRPGALAELFDLIARAN
ncbi:MAG: alpha/beta hydrolase [Mycobacterium sp.]|nr:alpha/beta hydrolase [Mycobacterium sp.]